MVKEVDRQRRLRGGGAGVGKGGRRDISCMRCGQLRMAPERSLESSDGL